MKLIIGYLMLLGLLFSCKQNNGRETYYDNGKLKSRTVYGANGFDSTFQEFSINGVLIREQSYKDSQLNGPAYLFLEREDSIVKGCYWHDYSAGPYRYYKNGGMVLYNEVDGDEKNFYVKKMDVNGNVIKEEGLSLSPFIYTNCATDTLKAGSQFVLNAFFAEPDGYNNTIEVKINKEKISFHRDECHILEIDTTLMKTGVYSIGIFSKLTNHGSLVAEDSVTKTIVVR